MKKIMLTSLLLSVLPLCSQADILYTVDFSAPLHINGQAITIDNSIYTPSLQTIGSTEVVSAYNGLDGDWGIFQQSSCSSYDQVRFDFPADQKEIYLELDLYTQGLKNSDNNFSIYVDSSGYGARNLSFHGSAGMRIFNFGSAGLGSYNDQSLYHIKAHANADADTFIITIDDAEVYSSTLGSTEITSIRLSLSPWTAQPSNCVTAVAAVSNIVIYEDLEDILPEPIAAPPKAGQTELSILSLLLLARLRKRCN